MATSFMLSSCGIKSTSNTQDISSIDPAMESIQPSILDKYSFEGTIFRYAGVDYDLAIRNEAINAILSCTPAKQYIVIKCHVGPKNGVYCIFMLLRKHRKNSREFRFSLNYNT